MNKESSEQDDKSPAAFPDDPAGTVGLEISEKDPADEKSDKKKKKKEKPEGPPPVSAAQLFRYASGTDLILIFLGILAAMGTGVCMPLMLVLFGDMTNAFVYGGFDPEIMAKCNTTFNITFPPDSNMTLPPGFPFNITETSFSGEIEKFAIGTASIGAALFALGYIFVTCLNTAAENQVHRIRGLFLQAILRQDIAWYDTRATNDFASRITEDLNKIQEGMGEKIGMFLFCFTAFLASIINAFVHGWELTLVMMSAMPVLAIAMGFLAKVQASLTENELKAYGKAGSVAEEVFSAIRAVMAFGGQSKEVARFEVNLESARQAGTKRGLATGIGIGLTFGIIYASYALAFWYGVKLILDGGASSSYDPSSLVIVFFSVLMGSMNVGQASPYVEAFSVARGAAGSIYEIIDRIPSIDSASTEGKKLSKVKGSISFEKVRFNYPTRPDVKILQGLSFSVSPGQTVALVGASGCGKSTCIQLIQRFYDPLEGSVRVDGEDIRDLNLPWLREQMGVVGQEPALFGTTIAENIRYGRENVTQKEIEEAARQANAHDFIMKLPQKYETMVGERGAKLSGGQKQRIAIARALVRNPKILLLDEATSALDTQSESIVQKALDRARLGRTTIIVAHRLSTIRNADRIMVLLEGELKEEGTHRQLMSKRGVYFQLVTAQAGEKDGARSPSLTPEESDTESAEDAELKKGKAWAEEDEISLSDALTQTNPHVLGRTSSVRSSTRKVSYEEEIVQAEGSTKDEEEEQTKDVPITKILKLNAKEWPYIATGVLGSVVVGLSTPAYAVLFGEILGSLAGLSAEEIRRESEFYALLFLIIGIIAGLASFFQAFMFATAGEFLTSRIRVLTFQSILRQEIGWFDKESNSVGSLCARLSGDASSVQGATGSRIGLVFQAVTTMCVSIGLSLYFQWKLGLVTMVFIPLVLISTFFQAKIIMGQNAMERKSLEKSAKIAMEGIANIRTVASLGLEKTFYKIYMKLLHEPHVAAQKRAHVRGVVFGFAQSIPMFAYSVCMFYGGYLVANECLEFEKVFKVSESLIFGTAMVGQAVAFAPNYNKAKVAANKIFQLLERKPLIDSSSTGGAKPGKLTGQVEYKNVKFHYPTRPDVTVLQELDIEIKPGQTVALVGRSGCGKSTCIQLLERFYDPDSGHVTLDNNDTTSLNIGSLRSHLGIVSQEPVLFNRTIGENIAYGDNTRTIPMEEIIEAARKANIHNFIKGLPLGYDTMVGERGTQLSGGQKQRVAIARALVRNPKILLLDEATSALDSESEKVVQEALDKAREGRTCITIAHRLSTIQNADKIVVIQNGKVEEQGTHQELLEMKGIYFELCTLQGTPMNNTGPATNKDIETVAL